jgi:hypothetical protein
MAWSERYAMIKMLQPSAFSLSTCVSSVIVAEKKSKDLARRIPSGYVRISFREVKSE